MKTNSFLRGLGILGIALGGWFELFLVSSSSPSILAEETCLALIVASGIAVLFSFYFIDDESGISRVQSNFAKRIRIGIASILFGFLFVFFLPLIPFKIAVSCPACNSPVGGYYTGYNSIGLEIFKWGASWQNFGQYYTVPVISVSGGVLSVGGVLFFLVLPASLIAAWIVIPELISGIRGFRLGFKSILTKAKERLNVKRQKTKSEAIQLDPQI